MSEVLPIEPLRGPVLDAISRGPVVVSAPTGSGKSTQVPRWLRTLGRVVVVEPRRVAARSLATRVAELEGVKAGREVGWVVRDEVRASGRTDVVFVTPGIALRWAASGKLADFSTLVLDEFHERGMDLDLLFAMCVGRKGPGPQLLVMSATLAGDRIAKHLGGVHLSGDGRLHPVDVRYLPGKSAVPDGRGLEALVRRALESTSDATGDALVFLPGKGEIARVHTALGSLDAEVLPLHGGLTLDQQRRVFRPGPRRRIILSTNVAETSLTIPRIGLVVDSGLVRRTRYRNGRAHLTLLPIALDSADQRAGRAGRLGPGIAVRLWRQDVRLDARTPPEIHREELGQLVLAAAACGLPRLERLRFLDPPKPHAVSDARARLEGLAAIDSEGAVTERGRRLFGLPLDVHLGRMLVEAEARDLLHLALPLAAGLSTSRPLVRPGEVREDTADDPIFGAGCDAVATIRAMSSAHARDRGIDGKALGEARSALRRMCRAFGVNADRFRGGVRVDEAARRQLVEVLLAAWPRCVHVKRRHGKRVGWANGGTELSLGRDTLVDGDTTDLVIVLDSRAFTPKPRRDEIVITAAMPVSVRQVVAAGRGRDQLREVEKVRGKLVARIERVYAGRVLLVREEVPTGAIARQAIARLILQNGLMGKISKQLKHRHERASLWARLQGEPALDELSDWLLMRLEEVGIEEPDDLQLLEPEDLLPPAVPAWEAERLDKDFPAELNVGDGRYRLAYDVRRKVCTLHQVGGQRKDPPPPRLLPRLPGWKLDWERKNRTRRLR